MKIAVSDFDNTLYFHRKNAAPVVPEINLEAIKKWRGAGNVFCFCSGRDMRSLMDEANRWGFDYDFVICNNGASIFDKDLKLLKSFPLDRRALAKLLLTELADRSWHLLFSAADKMSVVVQSDVSPVLQYFESPKYEKQRIINKTTVKDALENVNSVQLSCAYDDEETAKAFIAEVEKKYAGTFSAHRNLNYLDVCAADVSKANGIKYLAQLNGWQKEDIIAVGDSQNDVSMLKEFKGFSLYSAADEAKKCADRLYESVGEMLLDNLK